MTPRRRVLMGAGVSLGATLAFGAPAHATDFTVDTLDDTTVDPLPNNGCEAPGGNSCRLREAIQSANADGIGDQVLFQSGLSGTIALISGQLTVSSPVDIIGPGAQAITIDAGEISRIIDVSANPGTTRIRGLHLTDGNAGAGELGGAIRATNSSTVFIEDSILDSNTAGSSGGAIHANTTDLAVRRSTISGNTSGGNGGAIDTFEPGDPIVGIGCYATTTIENSTVSGNQAALEGGGLSTTCGYFIYQPHLIYDSTVVGNSAAAGDGGIGGTGFHSNVARNTIVADNTAPSNADTDGLTAASFSLIESPGFSDQGDNITGVDPQLGPLAMNGGTTPTMKPAATSPVIDKGITDATADQRGAARPFDVPSIANSAGAGADGADIGAVELTSAEATVPVVCGTCGNVSPPPPLPPPKKCKKGQKLKKGKCVKKKRRKRR